MEIFLIILALVYLVYASISDLKKREIPNWLSFSLIVFALAYRAFISAINLDLWYFIFGLLGLGVFVALGYGFYYARIFAGGDAKLLMAFGAVLPVSGFYSSLISSFAFIFLILFCGSIYGIIWSFYLILGNWKNFSSEFLKQAGKNKKLFYFSLALAVILIFLPVYSHDWILALIPVIFFLFPLLFIFAKAVEESCMIIDVKTSKLTEGDWLYEKVKIGRKTIKPYWEGLSLEEIKILRKYKGKVKIKQGIPFVPAFFFAFVVLIYLYLTNSSVLNILGIFF
ncbi:prepilin peptidase [Candidatus Pacearchaeota archaeon]|nr:prepilin peptidase [Candidatus Pacearchaeota archaeon]